MAESSSRPSLTVLGGPLAGARLVLEDGVDDVLIGSDPACGFCLPVPGVSPVHARVSLENGAVTLFDAKSHRGLYLNDEKVEDRIHVRNGDVIWLGSPGTNDAVMIQCRMPPPRSEAAHAAAAVAAAPAAAAAIDEPAVVEPQQEEEGQDDQAVAAEAVPEPEPDESSDVVEAHPVEASLVEDDPPAAEVAAPPEPDADADGAAEGQVVMAEPDADDAFAVEAAGVDERTRPLPIYRDEGEAAEPVEAEPAAVSASEFVIEESAEAVAAAPAPPPGEDEAFLMRDPEDFRVEEDASTITAMLRPDALPPRTPAGFEEDIDEAAAAIAAPPPPPAPPAAARPASPPADAEATAFLPPAVAPPATPTPPAASAPRAAAPPATARPATPTPPPAPARTSPRTSPGTRPGAPARTPAPPARRPDAKSGGGKGAVIGIAAAVAVAVVGAGGYFAYTKLAAPAATPAPPPVAVTVATTAPAPAPTTLVAEAVPTDAAPTPEPAPPPPEEAVTIVPSAPAVRPSAAASVPPKATPPPAVRPTPAPVAASAAPAPDPAAQRAAQVAGLLAQAEGAASAQSHDQAVSLFDEVLKLDPSNGRATAGRQAALAARDAGRRSFVPGRTVVRTEKAGGGLAGFDSSGVSVQKAPDFQGRIEFAMSPARIKAGDSYSLKVFVVNEGKKAIKISALSVVTTVNGSRNGGPANPLAREIEPQQRALIDERSGTWADGVSAWATEVTVTAKGDSLRNQLTWR